jgi:hypothetical protein
MEVLAKRFETWTDILRYTDDIEQFYKGTNVTYTVEIWYLRKSLNYKVILTVDAKIRR